ncbi:MAG: hypothetical protein SGILL_000906 [Bacillariaceae sp.]
MSDGSSDDDGDYAADNAGIPGSSSSAVGVPSMRYPVHDFAEFEDAETLRRLILRPVEDSDEEEEDYNHEAGNENDAVRKELDHDDDDSVEHDHPSAASSSDEGDSPAAVAAHVAATGQSPQPVPPQEKDDDEAEAGPAETKDGIAPEQKVNGDTNSAAVQEENPLGSNASADDDEEPNLEKSDSMEIDGEEPETKEGDQNDADYDDESPTGPPQPKTVRYFCPYNLNARDSDENTPLHVAILARKVENVKVLLEAGASVHKKSDGSAPLHTAISMGSLPQNADFAYECVKVLDEEDADLAVKDEALHTPLYLACMYNLPKVVTYLLSREVGMSTLNTKADRSQGRALHAAAKFNTAASATRQTTAASAHARVAQLHHPDGSVSNAMHHIPGYPGKQADRHVAAAAGEQPLETTTQILLKTNGIEIDAQNAVGQTPLHVACSRGNWTAVRELLAAGASPDAADRRGYTPGQFAHKRGVVIPNDLLETLGGPPSSGTVPPPRDLIVDPDSSTLLITHELCILHRTCHPIRRDNESEPPPENVRRLQVLVDKESGILRTGEFSKCNWQGEARRAALVDVLKVSDRLTKYRKCALFLIFD